MDPDVAATPPSSTMGLGVAAGLALLLLGAGIFELVADLLQRRAVVPRADWLAAGRAARPRLRPGDLIVTAPQWADPLGRLVLGDRMTLDDVTRPDARTYARIWELSIRGARHPDTAGATRRWRRQLGRVTLSLWEQRPVTVATDFYERLDQAEVYEGAGPSRRGCTWVPGHAFFDCGAGWKAVRRVRAEIDYSPKRCVMIAPQDGPARVIEFPALPLGERLVIWTGLAGYDPRYRARRSIWEWQRFRPSRFNPKKKPPPRVESVPVRLEVALDGRPVRTLNHAVEDESWHRHDVPLPRGIASGRVRFTVSTRYGWAKHFCFYARTEAGRP
jgi:hypothetical protein